MSPQCLDARLQRFQRTRRERRRQQLAHAGVVGRIIENQTRGVVLVEQTVGEIRPEIDLLVRAPACRVAVDFGAIVIAREKIRAVRHAMDRIVLAQSAIDRVGVVEEFRIELSQIEGERDFARRGGNFWRNRVAHRIGRDFAP
jgi:hypothetical protein